MIGKGTDPALATTAAATPPTAEDARQALERLADQAWHTAGDIEGRERVHEDRAIVLGSLATPLTAVCESCGHRHTADGCVGDPTPSDLWAGVSPSACDCDTPPTASHDETALTKSWWALSELVDLHDGPRDADYARRKPLAWQAAREALAARAAAAPDTGAGDEGLWARIEAVLATGPRCATAYADPDRSCGECLRCRLRAALAADTTSPDGGA